MQLRHNQAIFFSGFLWLIVGILLLTKGIGYLSHVEIDQGFSLIKKVGELANSPDKGMIIVICLALGLGFFKGRFVLKKSVHRVVTRIRSLPTPIPFTAIYTKGYLFLLIGMMGLGFLFKVLPLPLDVKGFIDLTIGVALMNGAMLYFRFIGQKSG